MTGPSHGAGPDKTVLVREGHCEPEVTVTTVYHLSLLPQWPSEEDPLLKKSATVPSITSSTSGQSKRGAATSSLFQSSFKISSPKGLVPSPPAYSNTYSFHFGSAAQVGPGPKVPSRRQSRWHESFSSFSSSVASGSSLVGTTPQFPSQLQPLPPVLHPLSGLSVSTGSQALPTSEVLLLPLEVRGRGLTRTPLEGEHPIEQFKDSDLLIRPYTQNVERAIRRYTGTSISSGTTSPTLIDSQSAASLSHNGWTTGNTTERSSLDSSYCFDDYDRTTASTVSQHYENFESLLYEGEGSRGNLVLQADMKKECQEWSSQFDYFRVLGQQIVKENRTEEDDEKKGFKYSPTLPAASSPALTRADSRETSFVYSESQGLTLTGQKAEMKQVSVYDDFSSSGHYLVEEVIEEEGLYEDIIAVDYKNNYDDFTEFKKQITPRRRRVGYPPVTPIACVKDSVTSAAFDHIWQEIMSWLRPLLLRFSSEITDSKAEVIQYSLPPQQPLQAQPSFILQTRQNSFHRSNTHMSQSIDGILHISSIPLVHRVEMPESHAPVAASAPPAPTKTVVRKVRLKPLPTQPRPQPVKQSSDLLKVRGSTAINLDNLPPPPPSRHGTLPPIDLEPKKFQPSHRAASAIDNKDNRHLPNKPHFMSEQARPNTTHAMRYDSMFGSSSLRRSSTPLGSSFSSRLHLPTSKSLDVRGSSLQPPDIIEDQQESPAEDSYRPQWTGPPAANTHINFGRNRLSLR